MSDFEVDLELLQIETTLYNEMNDQIFNIDTDMNMWDITGNVTKLISFHRFHVLSDSPILV
jgi:hypothetical protein